MDSNAYVSGGVCYETRPTNYSTILGAYHIELLTAFGSYEEALAVAQSYPKGFVAYIVCASATTRATMSPRACCRRRMCWPTAHRS